MAGQDEIGGRLLVIYDGQCGLCNRSVRWFLQRDRGDRLRFVAYESPKIAGLLERHGMSANVAERNSTVRPEPVPGVPGTILVVQDAGGLTERMLIRSDAVLAILRELPWPWPAMGKALGWIPRPLRDLGYRIIARWRYRIWGRLESCPVPTAEERTRFL